MTKIVVKLSPYVFFLCPWARCWTRVIARQTGVQRAIFIAFPWLRWSWPLYQSLAMALYLEMHLGEGGLWVTPIEHLNLTTSQSYTSELTINCL